MTKNSELKSAMSTTTYEIDDVLKKLDNYKQSISQNKDDANVLP